MLQSCSPHKPCLRSSLVVVSSLLRPIRVLLLLVVAVDISGIVAVEGGSRFTPEQIEFFESKVRPVLVAHCYECHSTDAAKLEAGLYVDSREAMFKGGESGPAIVDGNPHESLLIASVKYESNEMPPDLAISRLGRQCVVRRHADQ